MAQIRPGHICCLVLITSPDSYRKPLEREWAKGSSEGTATVAEPGDPVLPVLPPESAENQPEQQQQLPGFSPWVSRLPSKC